MTITETKKGGIDIDHVPIQVTDSGTDLNHSLLPVLPRKGIEQLNVNMVIEVVKL